MFNRIRKNIILSFIWNGFSQLFSAVTLFYVTRVLQPEVLGRVSFAVNTVGIFLIFAQLGMPVYGLRTCSKCRNNREELKHTVVELLCISLILHLITFLVFVSTVCFVPKLGAERKLFLIIGLGILFQSIGCEWLFKALEEYAYITSRSICVRLLSLLLLFAFVKGPADYLKYGIITVIAANGSNVVDLFRLRNTLHTPGSERRKPSLKHHIKPLLLFFMMSCAVSIYGHLDTVMLGFMKDDYTVGLYNVVEKAKGFLTLLGGIIWTVTLPEASQRWKKNDIKGFEALGRRSISLICLIQVPLTVFCMINAEEIICLIGGESYLPAVTAFRITLLSILPIGFSNICGGQLLIPSDREISLFKAEAVGAISNLLLNLLVIPSFSMNGAAATTVLAEVIVWRMTHYVVYHDIGIRLFSGKQAAKVCVGCIIAGSSCILLRNVLTIPLDSFMGIILKLSVSAFVFGILYFVSELMLKEENIYKFARCIWRKVRNTYYNACSRMVNQKKDHYECPCCGRKFYSFASGNYETHPTRFNPERYANMRQDVICPGCRSLPRHRILTYYLETHSELLQGKILHFAQERCVYTRMQRNGINNVRTADLYAEADLKVDIQDTGLPENEYSLIICNHVLEHVPDYKKALKELFRICAPGGSVMLSFPVLEQYVDVYEDPDITSQEDRVKYFGQNDHLRVFGRNAKALIENAGFIVEEIRGEELPSIIMPLVGPADYDSNVLYCCRKLS